ARAPARTASPRPHPPTTPAMRLPSRTSPGNRPRSTVGTPYAAAELCPAVYLPAWNPSGLSPHPPQQLPGMAHPAPVARSGRPAQIAILLEPPLHHRARFQRLPVRQQLLRQQAAMFQAGLHAHQVPAVCDRSGPITRFDTGVDQGVPRLVVAPAGVAGDD